MSNFTFQEENTNRPHETFEWDNIWWEHMDNTEAPRVLLIGDSISCGYRHILNKMFDGAVMIDSFGTSKGIDNPFFIPAVNMFIAQMHRCDMILFNNGLHGIHLSADDYKANCKKFIETLRAQYPSHKWAIALSTPVREASDLTKLRDRTDLVKERNIKLSEVANELGIPAIDFFSASIDHPEYWSTDGVHLNPDGYSVFAELCYNQIKKDLL